jgi:hypothetical protein
VTTTAQDPAASARFAPQVTTTPLTEFTADIVLRSVPEVRRQIYVEAVQPHDTLAAAELYLWNTYMSATLLRATGIVEVQVRNRIDAGLRAWNTRSGGDEGWICNPVGILTDIVKPASNKPLTKFANLSTTENATHDDYVAGLPFGSRIRLLPNKGVTSPRNPRLQMWDAVFRDALGHAERAPHGAASDQLFRLLTIRNRAAHHRPLLDTKALQMCHQDVLEVLGRFDRPLKQWMQTEKWIPRAVQAMPAVRLF